MTLAATAAPRDLLLPPQEGPLMDGVFEVLRWPLAVRRREVVVLGQEHEGRRQFLAVLPPGCRRADAVPLRAGTGARRPTAGCRGAPSGFQRAPGVCHGTAAASRRAPAGCELSLSLPSPS